MFGYYLTIITKEDSNSRRRKRKLTLIPSSELSKTSPQKKFQKRSTKKQTKAAEEQPGARPSVTTTGRELTGEGSAGRGDGGGTPSIPSTFNYLVTHGSLGSFQSSRAERGRVA